MRSNLQSLINEPQEDLAVEYKNWLNLNEKEDKAKLAKACIALANHGGGYLVLGFDEQCGSLTSVPCSANHAEITQDAINGVISSYADPSFHCRHDSIEHPTTNVTHSIVTVPSDLMVPVITKRDCGKIIQQHRCYVRKPGPCSEQPLTAEEWRTLLQRCARANRDDMLDAIRTIVLGKVDSETVESSSKQAIDRFCESSLARWKDNTKDLNPHSSERFPKGSYEVAIHPVGTETVKNLTILRERLAHARRIKLTGWTPFLELGREEWKPYSFDGHIEAWTGHRIDENTSIDAVYADFWRASRLGQLYTIRGYTEDSLSDDRGVAPGAVLDITLPIWRIGEILYFAARFLAEFQGVEKILIKCRFSGLKGRVTTSLAPSRFPSPRCCRQHEVKMSAATVDSKRLEDNMVEIIHELLTPLYEAFDFYKLTRILVDEELSRLRNCRY